MSFRSFCRLSKQGRWSKGPFALNEGRYNFVLLGQTSYLFSIACCVLCTLVLYALYLILCLCPVISHTVPHPPSIYLDYSIRLRINVCIGVIKYYCITAASIIMALLLSPCRTAPSGVQGVRGKSDQTCTYISIPLLA